MSLTPDEREWPVDKIIRLVEEYRSRPLLWNPNNEMFRIQSAKYQCWMEIARKFKCEVGFLRKKFNSIFASHRREKTKVRFGSRSGWFLYDHLSFLPSHVPNIPFPLSFKTYTHEEKQNQEYDMADEAQENSESEQDDVLHEEIMIKQEPEESAPPPKKKPPQKRFKSRPARVSRLPRSSRPPRIARHFVPPTEERPEIVNVIKPVNSAKDECDSFGEYIAVSLRKHDHRTQSMIKQAINNILFEQEMKKYNNSQYSVVDVEIEQNPLICDDDVNAEVSCEK